jgi:hypothetical protein
MRQAEQMSAVFLIGGGRDPEGVVASHGPFLEAAGCGPVVCVMYERTPGSGAQLPEATSPSMALSMQGSRNIRG